mmetsp:Transcript_8869/g.25815  ORF Transcript_8869/g.25815 Transcript_8869/m.25815 type:complete len:202 (-) Transcript_8869:641-1246(-)
MSSSCKATKISVADARASRLEFCKLATARSNTDGEATSTNFGRNSFALSFSMDPKTRATSMYASGKLESLSFVDSIASVSHALTRAFGNGAGAEDLASAWTMCNINGLDSSEEDAMTRTMSGEDGPNRRAKPATGPCNPSRSSGGSATYAARTFGSNDGFFAVNAHKSKEGTTAIFFALSYGSDLSFSSPLSSFSSWAWSS